MLGTALAGRSLLLATMGEPLNPDEFDTFQRFTGRTTPPSQRVDELWCCVGRRGGKSRGMAVLATYLAGLCDYSDKLSPGERGVVLLLSPDMKQAKVLFDYAEVTHSGADHSKKKRGPSLSQCRSMSGRCRCMPRYAELSLGNLKRYSASCFAAFSDSHKTIRPASDIAATR